MMRTESSPLPHLLAVGLCLTAVPLLGAWPIPQTLFNTMLVVGFAPEFRSPLVAGLFAAATGWLLELTLRSFTDLGGTPLANLTVTLLAHWTLKQWPPSQESTFRGRLALLVVLHALLTILCVQLAAGTHAWNLWGWALSLGTSPLWALPVARFYCPPQRR